MAYLHLIPNDKFGRTYLSLLKRNLPGKHSFLLTSLPNTNNYLGWLRAYLKTAFFVPAFFLKRTINRSDIIFVHALDENSKRLINLARKDAVIIWISWGGDIYAHANRKLQLKQTEQLEISLKQEVHKTLFQRFISKKLRIFKNSFAEIPVENIKFSGISYFNSELTLLPAEILKETVLLPHLLPLEENDLLISRKRPYEESYLIVGNSATPENNHLDVIHNLFTLGVDTLELRILLNYGDQEYRQALIEKISNDRTNNIKLLTKWLSKNDWLNLIANSKGIILGHLRSQGLANILAAFYYEVPVILYKDNPLFYELSLLGFNLIALDDLSLGDLNTVGNVIQQDHLALNRQRLTQLLSGNWNSLFFDKLEKLLENSVN